VRSAAQRSAQGARVPTSDIAAAMSSSPPPRLAYGGLGVRSEEEAPAEGCVRCVCAPGTAARRAKQRRRRACRRRAVGLLLRTRAAPTRALSYQADAAPLRAFRSAARSAAAAPQRSEDAPEAPGAHAACTLLLR
jgi:hypothetical protein